MTRKLLRNPFIVAILVLLQSCVGGEKEELTLDNSKTPIINGAAVDQNQRAIEAPEVVAIYTAANTGKGQLKAPEEQVFTYLDNEGRTIFYYAKSASPQASLVLQAENAFFREQSRIEIQKNDTFPEISDYYLSLLASPEDPVFWNMWLPSVGPIDLVVQLKAHWRNQGKNLMVELNGQKAQCSIQATIEKAPPVGICKITFYVSQTGLQTLSLYPEEENDNLADVYRIDVSTTELRDKKAITRTNQAESVAIKPNYLESFDQASSIQHLMELDTGEISEGFSLQSVDGYSQFDFYAASQNASPLLQLSLEDQDATIISLNSHLKFSTANTDQLLMPRDLQEIYAEPKLQLLKSFREDEDGKKRIEYFLYNNLQKTWDIALGMTSTNNKPHFDFKQTKFIYEPGVTTKKTQESFKLPLRFWKFNNRNNKWHSHNSLEYEFNLHEKSSFINKNSESGLVEVYFGGITYIADRSTKKGNLVAQQEEAPQNLQAFSHAYSLLSNLDFKIEESSSVGADFATIHFALENLSRPATLTLYWGLQDPGIEADNWEHQTQKSIAAQATLASISIENLVPQKNYFLRAMLQLDNQVLWLEENYQIFTTGQEASSYWNNYSAAHSFMSNRPFYILSPTPLVDFTGFRKTHHNKKYSLVNFEMHNQVDHSFLVKLRSQNILRNHVNEICDKKSLEDISISPVCGSGAGSMQAFTYLYPIDNPDLYSDHYSAQGYLYLVDQQTESLISQEIIDIELHYTKKVNRLFLNESFPSVFTPEGVNGSSIAFIATGDNSTLAPSIAWLTGSITDNLFLVDVESTAGDLARIRLRLTKESLDSTTGNVCNSSQPSDASYTDTACGFGANSARLRVEYRQADNQDLASGTYTGTLDMAAIGWEKSHYQELSEININISHIQL